MHSLKIIAGLLALAAAWVMFFRRQLIYKLNAVMREHVFNDKLVLFSGRRLACLLLLLGAVALFSGLDGLTDAQPIRPKIAAQMLEQAQLDFQQKRYNAVEARCKDLVRSDQKNVEAWELLAKTWLALGEREKAYQAIHTVLRLEPTHPFKKIRIAEPKKPAAEP